MLIVSTVETPVTDALLQRNREPFPQPAASSSDIHYTLSRTETTFFSFASGNSAPFSRLHVPSYSKDSIFAHLWHATSISIDASLSATSRIQTHVEVHPDARDTAAAKKSRVIHTVACIMNHQALETAFQCPE